MMIVDAALVIYPPCRRGHVHRTALKLTTSVGLAMRGAAVDALRASVDPAALVVSVPEKRRAALYRWLEQGRGAA